VETNIAWHQVQFHERLGSRTSKWFKNRHVSTTWNIHKQPLSTSQASSIALLTTNKLTYQVGSSGHDSTGPGRWMWTHFQGKNNHHTRVVTYYRPVKNEKGPLLVYDQHCCFLIQQDLNICPLHHYMIDLKSPLNSGNRKEIFSLLGVTGMKKFLLPPGMHSGMMLDSFLQQDLFRDNLSLPILMDESNWIWFM